MRNYNIILGSNSPRRRELLAGLDLENFVKVRPDFNVTGLAVKVIPDIDESFPEGLDMLCVAQYIAERKADAYRPQLLPNDLLITADTIVVVCDEHNERYILGKPCDLSEARAMLLQLSGRTHHVVTGVCLTTADRQRSFAVTADVTFKVLTDAEIDYYVEHYKPLDKAGAYGIQEWIGHIGVTNLNGSYSNVMGLPVQALYDELQRF